MITNIAIKGFKPFGGKTTARLAPITLIYGPNSSGKSSLIQSLLLLKQSFEHHTTDAVELVPRGRYVDLGSFKTLVHRHNASRQLDLSLGFAPRNAPGSRSRLRERSERRVSLSFKAARSSSDPSSKGAATLARVRYQLEKTAKTPALNAAFEPLANAPRTQKDFEEVLGLVGTSKLFEPTRPKDTKSLARFLYSRFGKRGIHGLGERKPRLKKGYTWTRARGEQPDPLSLDELVESFDGVTLACHLGLPAAIALQGEQSLKMSARTLLFGLVQEFSDLLSSVSYLGPLRSYPARHYVAEGAGHASVGTRGEFTPSILFQKPRAIPNQVNKWFDQFEIPYRLAVSDAGNALTGTIISLSLTDKRSGVAVAPSDVGFGIGQLLPILVEGATAENRIICVEQPEIHLHPALQAHLADFLIHTLQSKKRRRNQWIIETHSEALILRLQRRIRAKALSAQDVCVLYVHPDKNSTKLLELRLDDNGDFLDEWPDGFFDEGFREIFDL